MNYFVYIPYITKFDETIKSKYYELYHIDKA